jgi:hypothetical protein
MNASIFVEQWAFHSPKLPAARMAGGVVTVMQQQEHAMVVNMLLLVLSTFQVQMTPVIIPTREKKTSSVRMAFHPYKRGISDSWCRDGGVANGQTRPMRA